MTIQLDEGDVLLHWPNGMALHLFWARGYLVDQVKSKVEKLKAER